MKKNIRLSRTELANRLIAISDEVSKLSKHINNTDANHYITNINILTEVDARGYCDEENNRVEKEWYADSDLFDEEDARRECINRTLNDLRNVVGKYEDKADEGLLGELKVGDYETIYYGVNDIGYANDLNDTLCVEDNWYNLFKRVKKVNPDVHMTFESSWGSIDVDINGDVINVIGDKEIDGDANPLYDIRRVDIFEYGKFCESKNITTYECEDILCVGYWTHSYQYTEPDKIFRDTIFNTEDKPTELCKDKDKHNVVKDIISKLKEIDIDGETMQYILKQVGMEEQMHRQLVMDKDFKQTKDLLREKFETEL